MVETTRNKYQALVGLVFLIVPLLMLSYWIHISNKFETHEARLLAYFKILPDLLQSGLSSTLFSMTCSALALVLATRSLSSSVGFWRGLNLFIIITGVGLFLLNGWAFL